MLAATVWPVLAAGAPAQGDLKLIHFGFEQAAQVVSRYEFNIYENGAGVYLERATGDSAQKPAAGIRVSPATLATIFAAKDAVIANQCGTKAKNIADTGTKTLEYFSEGVKSACVFNYSDDAKVRDAASAFIAMAETLQMGNRLAHERRFDRLALDAELDSLTDEVKAGRAIEVQNIAPVLRGIVGDEALMERVRSKAAHLLESAGGVDSVK
jgi:hypothetical protein